MSKRMGTDGSLLASLPWTLGALAFSILPHIQFLPIWATLAFFACAVWRWLLERKRWRLPPAWLRIVLSLIFFIGVIAAYDTISGVGPGSALLTVMAALKLLETKRRRDQFVLLFISIFLIMSSLLREQYLWSLPYLVAGVLLTMTAWLRMSTASSVGATQSFRTGARLIAYAAPLTIAMWIFFPRIATPFWAVPIDTSAASSGLSENMSPGDISSLSLSNAVAFRVKFDNVIPPPHELYWRGLILHDFNGRSWTGDKEPSVAPRARRNVEYLGAPVRYQITMEPTQQHWVFALDVPSEWDLDRTFMGRQHQLARVQPIDQRIAYSVISHPRYRLNSELSEYWRGRYAELPANRNPRTVELARQMRNAAQNDEDFITNVLDKFNKEEYFYTLEPPLLGSNPVDRFLFDTRRGFCEHYASAFAVMMRAAGIPSRIVLGYQGGEINPMGAYMIVRQADAHAWTEVWLPGRGWYRVDPTAAVAPERIESGRSGAMFDGIGASWGLSAPSELLYKITLTWDVLNAKWNEWILAYGPENQNRFMEWLGMEEPNWRQMMLTLIAIVVVMIAIISVLLLLRYRPPPKDAAAVLYRKFTDKTGLPPSRGETPLSYALRLAREKEKMAADANSITAQYLDARYGPPGLVAIDQLQAAVFEFARQHQKRLIDSRF
jgi:transglutaminase-like putative cysteine protease